MVGPLLFCDQVGVTRQIGYNVWGADVLGEGGEVNKSCRVGVAEWDRNTDSDAHNTQGSAESTAVMKQIKSKGEK